MPKTKKIIFIEWSKYNTRGASLSSHIDAKMFFIGIANVSNNPFRSLLSYFPKAIENLKILNKEKPDVVIITNTIWIIALLNFCYSKLFGIKLILDSHSCAFDHSFFKYPLFLSKYFAQHTFMSFVTNESHKHLLDNIGADALVINDIPYEEKLITNEKIELKSKFNICYVCTFAEDEPFLEVIEAAGHIMDVHIFITGRYKRVGLDPNKYNNVTFLGFISNEDYKLYLNNADAVMTLTTREDTMQRAGSEAVSVMKPLITSDTKMLRNTFYKGAVFVDNSAEGIEKGILKMKNNLENYKTGMRELQVERKSKFLNKLNIIKEKLEI